VGSYLELFAKLDITMRLRNKPKMPVLKPKVRVSHSIDDGDSLQSIVGFFEGCDLSKVYLNAECSHSYYDDEIVMRFATSRPETTEEFAVRMDTYNRQLEIYNKWYGDNKEEIEKEVAVRKEKAEEKFYKDKLKEKKRLEKERNKMARELAKLEKMLEV